MDFLPDMKVVVTAIALLTVFTISYYILKTPDNRNFVQKTGDAVSEMSKGSTKAARQFEDRTPGDKIQDAVQDKRQEIKDSINQK